MDYAPNEPNAHKLGRHANSCATRANVKSAKRTRDWQLGQRPLATMVLGCAFRSKHAAKATELDCRSSGHFRPH